MADHGTRLVTIVSFNRGLAWRMGILSLMLSWPLILFGHPSYITDSVSYLKGGKFAVEFVTGDKRPVVIAPAASTAFPPGPSTAPQVEGPKGARSITYSVLAYLLRWPGNDMTALAIVQILIVAFIGAVVAGVAGVRSNRGFLILGGILAAATPLAVFASFAVPDVLAGALIATIALLVVARDRMSTCVRSMTAAITAFTVTTHASIPPLAVGMTLVGAGVLVAGSRFGLRPSRSAWFWLVAPPLLGLATTVATGFIAFGEVSVAAKRYPVTLARSVSDGPARWYLERHCATARYAVCEVFGTHIPKTVSGFLFDKTGLNGRATPDQMDRIRREEPEIVLRAGLEYPAAEGYNLSRNIVRQLFRFDLGVTHFEEKIVVDNTGKPKLATVGNGNLKTFGIVELLTNFALALSVVWAVWAYRRLNGRERLALFMIIVGLVGNAVVVVVFSGILSRYQARVIWLLPMFALSMAAARFNRSSRNPDAQGVPTGM